MPPMQKDGQRVRKRSTEFNWNHAMDMMENMGRIQEILMPFQQEEDRRQRKLKEFPKGFHLEGKGYMCAICHGSCSQEDTWYDQYGVKCMACQGAVDRGEIPASCAEDTDSWYSPWEIENALNVDRHVVRRWTKAGVLKARTVKREGHQDTHLYLIEENKDTLPPKKMVKDYSWSEPLGDGRFTMHTENWFDHVDPFEYLKGYKILDHLQMVNGKLEAKPKDKK